MVRKSQHVNPLGSRVEILLILSSNLTYKPIYLAVCETLDYLNTVLTQWTENGTKH